MITHWRRVSFVAKGEKGLVKTRNAHTERIAF